MDWFRLASHLCMPVSEIQEKTTSTEFLKWRWFLNWKDVEEFNRTDYYLAQIAATVERGYAKHPNRSTINSKLLTFKFSKEKTAMVDDEVRIQNSKNFWLGLSRLPAKTPKR